LAATVGYLALEVRNYAPAAIVVAFIPIIFIAIAYRELNRVIPDCGTTFTWGTKAFNPRVGWMGGWGVAVAGVIFMANAADIVGIYAVELFGSLTGNPDPSALAGNKLLVAAIGVLFIVVMSYINYRGIEGGARMQYFMVAVQFLALAAIIVAAFWHVSQGTQNPDADPFSLSWFDPFQIDDFSAFVQAALLAIFIFWGFDTTLAINEETTDSERTPGRAAVISTVILLGTYVLVTVALQMYAGVEKSGLGSKRNADDVFAVVAEPLLGSWGLPLLLLAVLLSAAASMQTTIMPTARGTLAMGVYKALPAKFADVHPRFKSPSFSLLLRVVFPPGHVHRGA
jgi:amino acid transporter